MNEVREIINISYFDNKNTTLKEHCDIYSNIKKEVLNILNKYDIKYVVAETEAIRDLVKENQQLKEQYCERTDCSGRIGNSKKVEDLEKRLKASEKAIKEAIEYINTTDCCTWDNTSHEDLLKILDIKENK